jgi:hypothetical protein
MRVDHSNLLENEIKDIKDLDDLTIVEYPTGADFMTKKEILAKLSEIEFRLEGTWTPEFIDEFECTMRYMKAEELAGLLKDKLYHIFDWDDSAYLKVL